MSRLEKIKKASKFQEIGQEDCYWLINRVEELEKERKERISRTIMTSNHNMVSMTEDEYAGLQAELKKKDEEIERLKSGKI